MNRTSTQSQLAVLMFCDIEGSVLLKQKAGSLAYGRALASHDALFKEIVRKIAGAAIVKDTGDGFFTRFDSVGDAINAALLFQFELSRPAVEAASIRSRVGIHLGQVAEIADTEGGQPKLVGLSADIASRVMGLAAGGQILLTRAAFDDGRQFVRDHPTVDEFSQQPVLRWLAHGQYALMGLEEEPLEIFEVGAVGVAPFTAPSSGPKAKRIRNDQEEILGWRPAIGADIPGRSGWTLQRRLGEGGFGEVWLGLHRRLEQRRVFKFCFDASRVRSLKREMTLFRVLQVVLGDRQDIAKLYEVRLDEPPYFLESEYSNGGNLSEWAERQGGIDKIPLASRLDLLAAAAEAVAAAHSVNVLHKDIKPSNILIDTSDGTPRPRLADFGIGMLTDAGAAQGANITMTGFTQMTADGSSRANTPMYAPPELLEGKAFTVQGDVYSLGVLLYQMIIGNLERSLAQGWERNVDDPLLREDVAACVDGEPSRRLPSALELAARLRLLPQRRAMVAEQDRARAQMEEAQKREAEARAREELAKLAEARTKSLLAQVYVRDGLIWLEQGDSSLALLFFVHALAAESSDPGALRNHRVRIGSTFRHIPPVLFSDNDAVPDDPAIIRFGRFELIIGGLGGYLVHGDSPEQNRVVHLNTGRPVAAGSPTHHSTFSPDGTRIATASADRSARVWDVASNQPVSPPVYHTGAVEYVAFSPDGCRMITASADHTARIWDACDGTPLCEPIIHPDIVFDAIFNHDGTEIATVCIGDRVQIWDASPAIPIAQEVSLRGYITDVRRVRPIHAPLWYPKGIRYVVFSADGERISARYDNHQVISRDLSRRQWHEMQLKLDASVHQAVFSSTGTRILTASEDGSAAMWDARSGKRICAFRHSAPVRMATFGKDDATVLTASMDDTACLWDAATAQQIFPPMKHSDGVQGAHFSPDGRLILTTALDDTARLWDAQNGRLITRLQWRNPGGVHDAGSIGAFSPDGLLIATASSTRTICIWNASDGSYIENWMYLHQGAINSISFSPDSRSLLTCGDDKVAHVFHFKMGKMACTLPHAAPVVWATFSPDGRSVATTSVDQTARIWDAATGTPRTHPMRHDGRVNFASFSDDGAFLVTASDDGAARVWECASGRPLTLPLRHPARVLQASFHRQGIRLVTACGDGCAYDFDLSPDERPLEELLGHAEILAAHRLDETGTLVKLGLEEWRGRAGINRPVYTVSP